MPVPDLLLRAAGAVSDLYHSASKAALNIINKALTIDLQNANVSSVLLHPGYVATDMNGEIWNWQPKDRVRSCTCRLLFPGTC